MQSSPNFAGFVPAPFPAPWWWLQTPIPHADRPALIDSAGARLCRAELAQQVAAVASFLRDRGVAAPHRLALMMAPGPSLAVSLLAGMAVAAVAPLSPSTPPSLLLEDLVRLRISHLLVDGEPPAALREAAQALGLPLLSLPHPLPAPPAAASPAPLPAAEDLALLLQTSGTTSRPKVVPLSHANLLASARAVAQALELAPEDRSLTVMPLFHIHGIVASLLAPLLAGGSVICCRSQAPDALLPLLSSLQPTWLSAVPTLLQALLARIEQSGEPPPAHRLRLLRSSSSPLPPPVLARLEAVFGVPVLEAYGMTEAAHQICSNRPPGSGAGRQPGSVGPPAGPELVVLGPDRSPLPAGQIGEVAIRGENVTRGYEAADHSGWVEVASGERWFLTGDEGSLDACGRLSLSGRLKEMINRGGEKVIPRRVDELLLQHPAVQQAVAFAVPHPTLGEDLAAAVVLRPGASVDEQDLRRLAAASLAPHEVPSRILLLDDLPRGVTGKLQRIGLADRLAAVLQPDHAPVQGELEALVADTIAAVLQQSPPGRDANFLLLGGDSLSSTRVVLRLAESLSLELSPTVLFQHPTPRLLAAHLDQQLEQALAALEAEPA
ncbi:MAG: AMP-binding protein [Synechococcaceae cyanobacterium]|nr:AMP-binding protein [Synechococcaceae cyanobacterium]